MQLHEHMYISGKCRLWYLNRTPPPNTHTPHKEKQQKILAEKKNNWKQRDQNANNNYIWAELPFSAFLSSELPPIYLDLFLLKNIRITYLPKF